MFRAKELFVADPGNVRYTIKYRACDAKLELKVTDDKTCLKFKTDQQSDVKKMENFNTWFFEQTTNKRPRIADDNEAAGDVTIGAKQHQRQLAKPSKRRKGGRK